MVNLEDRNVVNRQKLWSKNINQWSSSMNFPLYHELLSMIKYWSGTRSIIWIMNNKLTPHRILFYPLLFSPVLQYKKYLQLCVKRHTDPDKVFVCLFFNLLCACVSPYAYVDVKITSHCRMSLKKILKTNISEPSFKIIKRMLENHWGT